MAMASQIKDGGKTWADFRNLDLDIKDITNGKGVDLIFDTVGLKKWRPPSGPTAGS